ncbi:MAG: DcaP family trimeric outer membrane transporter [Rikenellaceae bacterium]
MAKKLLTLLIATATFFMASASNKGLSAEETQKVETSAKAESKPSLTINEDGKYSISVSGNVNMRLGYDFNGSITSHPDFVTALIPVPGDYSSDKFFYMDATTSRVEVKGLAKSEKLGDVVLCLNMDFRGGSMGSYTPRLRLAYVEFAGFTIGRSYTTFCDLGAAVPNIDFEGPCVCPYIYTTQLGYTHSWLDERVNIGVALEHHGYQSMSLNDDFVAQSIYLPTIPAHVEYKWGKDLNSHIRLTGLYKSNPVYDVANDRTINLNGWGTQLSGSIGVGERLKFYYSGTCGEGITDFMQDLYGSGLDVTMSDTTTPQPQLTFMNGWQIVGLMQTSERTLISMGYSAVNICGDASRFEADDYRRGEYAYANIFYSLTPRIKFATEYLWGKRKNVNNESNTANRINAMVQYSF